MASRSLLSSSKALQLAIRVTPNLTHPQPVTRATAHTSPFTRQLTTAPASYRSRPRLQSSSLLVPQLRQTRHNHPNASPFPTSPPSSSNVTGIAAKRKEYVFSDVKSLISDPPDSTILIDVREPSEYKDGHIPTAQNVPLNSSPEALFLPAEEFEDKFGFAKPDVAEDEVVFYCRSGVRSASAAKLAEQNGYEKVGEYRGSWLDWVENGGEKET